jgi:hypothetical protein
VRKLGKRQIKMGVKLFTAEQAIKNYEKCKKLSAGDKQFNGKQQD